MRHTPDDRRYESFETRAAYDSRYVKVAAKERTITTCYCGKTVTHVNDVPNGVTCPRECEKNRAADAAMRDERLAQRETLRRMIERTTQS